MVGGLSDCSGESYSGEKPFGSDHGVLRVECCVVMMGFPGGRVTTDVKDVYDVGV